MKHDVNKKQMIFAFKNDNIELVKKYVKLKMLGRDINFNIFNRSGKTPLMVSIRNRSMNVFLYTMENRKIMKMDLNIRDKIYGMTGSMIAARDGNEFMLRTLLNTGEIDLDIVDYKGFNLLNWGMISAFEEIPKIISQYYLDNKES